MRKTILFLLVLIAPSLQATILETEHFYEINQFLTPETVILLDVDDTLLVPVQMLGCDEWFKTRLNYHLKNGCTQSESLEKSLAEWEAIRHLTKMEIVEPQTEQIIMELQNKNFIVMAVTTQGLALATRTKQQLEEHGINLSHSSPSSEDHYFTIENHGVLFRNGILFTSGTHKGKAVFSLFDRIGFSPKRLLFINDKEKHLKTIESEAHQRGIEFIGLRYSYSDKRKAAFDKQIADYQFSHSTFTHILSDEEAKQKLINPTIQLWSLQQLQEN